MVMTIHSLIDNSGRLAAICILAGLTACSTTGMREHRADPMKIFIKDQSALEVLLPAGAAITQHEQELGAEAVEWAGEYYGVDLDIGAYTYHLARERATDRILGAAMIADTGYRDGRMRLAVGIDDEGNVTRSAVLGISGEYLADYEAAGIGTGFLDRFDGQSLVEFTDQINALRSQNEAAAIAAAGLFETTVVLAALVRGVR